MWYEIYSTYENDWILDAFFVHVCASTIFPKKATTRITISLTCFGQYSYIQSVFDGSYRIWVW